MKRIVVYLCAGILVLNLAACGNVGKENSSQEAGQGSSNGQSGDNGGTAEGGSQEEESGALAEGGQGLEEGEEMPEQGAEGWSQEMEGLKQAVVDALGEDNYWPNMPLDSEMVEMFYGITPDMYEDYMAETPMISANVDALVIVKAKADQADAVEKALNDYREANVNDTMQYPQNLGKIQASQVERIGDYVIFVQLGGYAIDEGTEEEVISLCAEANQLALDTIRGKLGDA